MKFQKNQKSFQWELATQAIPAHFFFSSSSSLSSLHDLFLILLLLSVELAQPRFAAPTNEDQYAPTEDSQRAPKLRDLGWGRLKCHCWSAEPRVRSRLRVALIIVWSALSPLLARDQRWKHSQGQGNTILSFLPPLNRRRWPEQERPMESWL